MSKPSRRVYDENAQLENALSGDAVLLNSLRKEDKLRRRTGIAAGAAGVLAIAFVVALITARTAPGVDKATGASLAQAGWELWKAGNGPEAEKKFQEAVESNPKLTEAWNGLGWSRMQQMKWTEAQAAFEQCLKLSPKHPAALNGMGQSLLSQGKLPEAKAFLTKAAPQSSAAWMGLARIALLEEDYPVAEKWSKKVLATDSGNEWAQGILKSAKERRVPDDLKKEIAPSANVDPQIAEGWRLMNSGDSAGAKEKFEAVLEKNPQAFGAHNGLGFLLLSQGDTDTAQKHFLACLEAEPDAGGPLNGLARCYRAQGKTNLAIETWKKMADDKELNAGTIGLAEAYLEQEDYKNALPYLEAIARARPNDQRAKANLENARKKLDETSPSSDSEDANAQSAKG